MNDHAVEKNPGVEIDLKRLTRAVIRKSWLVALVCVLFAVGSFCFTFFFVTPQYESSAMFYVNNSSLSVGDTSLSISTGDISAAKDLVESYIVILNTRTTLNKIIDYAEVDYTPSQLRDMISAQAVNSTEIFEVVVTSPDPKEAAAIADAICKVLPNRIDDIIEGTSARIVDTAVVAATPSSPSYTKNVVIGFAIGLLLSVGAVVLREIFDITIRTEEDMEQVCRHPVLAAVPDMGAPTKGGSYYAYGRGHKEDASTPKRGMIGEDISFAASESYKLLRTKIQFSFTGERNCRILGLSSALSGEGKSTTAVNLVYSLSQLDKKVLLIDCDMRRPSLADKLKLQKQPGLSGYLTGQQSLQSVIQSRKLTETDVSFDVIAAGQNPPNPIELLSSARMSQMLEKLRETYDYIILDLPPVGEVSDAMAIGKELDGMLLVVRQNYCDRMALKEAVTQFEFIGTKILGIVYNCTVENSGKYGKRYYKRYYGGRYHRHYYSHYYGRNETADRNHNDKK